MSESSSESSSSSQSSDNGFAGFGATFDELPDERRITQLVTRGAASRNEQIKRQGFISESEISFDNNSVCINQDFINAQEYDQLRLCIDANGENCDLSNLSFVTKPIQELKFNNCVIDLSKFTVSAKSVSFDRCTFINEQKFTCDSLLVELCENFNVSWIRKSMYNSLHVEIRKVTPDFYSSLPMFSSLPNMYLIFRNEDIDLSLLQIKCQKMFLNMCKCSNSASFTVDHLICDRCDLLSSQLKHITVKTLEIENGYQGGVPDTGMFQELQITVVDDLPNCDFCTITDCVIKTVNGSAPNIKILKLIGNGNKFSQEFLRNVQELERCGNERESDDE
ncbi:Hypothetical_protein [Hexamita inflata]|uniref:Hypothetical_protein n=1 Tax=Hexamita inflata TaxID=28002 RepID=A0AA86RAC9_9EUKA|nr:Hypothetical protein HINF_LOCUS61385 [Hexamita inflata]